MTGEESFKEPALANASKDQKDDYKKDEATLMKNTAVTQFSQISDDAVKWAASAKKGDKKVFETDAGCYVVYIVEAAHRDASEPWMSATFSLRWIRRPRSGKRRRLMQRKG